jgi:hypothetical protein
MIPLPEPPQDRIRFAFPDSISLVKESLPTRHRTVILPTSKLPECNALNIRLPAKLQNPGFQQL